MSIKITWRNVVYKSDRSGHLAAAAVAGLCIALFNPLAGAIVFGWELLATPDLDLSENRKGSNLIEWLWILPWKPYGWMIKHRHSFSHSLLIGTPFRFCYVALLLYMASKLLSWDTEYLAGLNTWAFFILKCGWVADSIHLTKDRFSLIEILLGKQGTQLVRELIRPKRPRRKRAARARRRA